MTHTASPAEPAAHRPSPSTGHATIPIGDATLEDDFGALLEFNRLLGWWAMGEPIDAASIADPATRALAHGMRGERSEAEEVAASVRSTRLRTAS